MPEWLFNIINPLVPEFVRRWLLCWLFDGLWPRWRWLGFAAPWAMAFGIGKFGRRIK